MQIYNLQISILLKFKLFHIPKPVKNRKVAYKFNLIEKLPWVIFYLLLSKLLYNQLLSIFINWFAKYIKAWFWNGLDKIADLTLMVECVLLRMGMEPKVLTSVINTSSGRCWSSEINNPVPGAIEKSPSNDNYQVI